MNNLIEIIRNILLVVSLFGAAAGIVLLVFDGDINKIKEKFGKKEVPGKKVPKEKENKQDKKENKKEKKKGSKKEEKIIDSRNILDFDEIRAVQSDTPIGIIVRNNKTEFVGVIEVKGINFNLLSLSEKDILEESFARLLNGIDYNISISIQSRKLEMDKFSLKYKKRLEELEKEHKKLNEKVLMLEKKLPQEHPEVTNAKTNLYRLESQLNYGIDLYNYSMERCLQKDMLERKYFICISHKHNYKKFNEELTYDEKISNAFFDIANKASSIISALQRAKLNGRLLSPVEVGELIYTFYNKEDSDNYKIRKALETKFNSYFITAEPVELKMHKRKIDELENMEKELKEEISKDKLRGEAV